MTIICSTVRIMQDTRLFEIDTPAMCRNKECDTRQDPCACFAEQKNQICQTIWRDHTSLHLEFQVGLKRKRMAEMLNDTEYYIAVEELLEDPLIFDIELDHNLI
jgi:hypothetical protein